jgi:hypothetical protein
VILDRLQSLLGQIYDVEPPLDVAAFLVTDPSVASRWSTDAPGTDEALFLRETGDGLEIALFVDGAVLERLESADPFAGLTEDNLQDCCTALEGVSHLLYLAWSALQDRPVSLLELETQAEVDKFAATLVLSGARPGAEVAALHGRLFERVRFAAGLDPERLGRYQAANRFAARFCHRLARRWLQARRPAHHGLFGDLRRFYRMPHARKIAHAHG